MVCNQGLDGQVKHQTRLFIETSNVMIFISENDVDLVILAILCGDYEDAIKILEEFKKDAL